MSDEQQAPVFQIQRVYLKDMSLEQPNSPAILASEQQPEVDIQLAMGMEQVAEGIVEVTVTATVKTQIEDKTVFLVEVKQAGIFEIRHLPEDQMGPVVGIACPQIIYPLLAQQCGGRDSTRRFPARAFVGNQFPIDVRAAASCEPIRPPPVNNKAQRL